MVNRYRDTVRHRWHHNAGICVHCGMIRRRDMKASRPRHYYSRLGAMYYNTVPDCVCEWPDDWMANLRRVYYIKPPAIQLALFNFKLASGGERS